MSTIRKTVSMLGTVSIREDITVTQAVSLLTQTNSLRYNFLRQFAVRVMKLQEGSRNELARQQCPDRGLCKSGFRPGAPGPLASDDEGGQPYCVLSVDAPVRRVCGRLGLNRLRLERRGAG